MEISIWKDVPTSKNLDFEVDFENLSLLNMCSKVISRKGAKNAWRKYKAFCRKRLKQADYDRNAGFVVEIELFLLDNKYIL